MRRTIAIALCVLLAVLASQSDATSNPQKDFVVGGGQHGDIVKTNQGMAAHSDPAGGNPQGHISATVVVEQPNPEPDQLQGEVICLHVMGNQAFMLAVMRQPFGQPVPFPAGTVFLTHVVDNGNPASGAPPDMIRNSFPGFFTDPQVGFPCGLPLLDPIEVDSGNYVVRDAP